MSPVKSAHVVTYIEQSLVSKGHLYLYPVIENVMRIFFFTFRQCKIVKFIIETFVSKTKGITPLAKAENLYPKGEPLASQLILNGIFG